MPPGELGRQPEAETEYVLIPSPVSVKEMPRSHSTFSGEEEAVRAHLCDLELSINPEGSIPDDLVSIPTTETSDKPEKVAEEMTVV